MLNIPVPIEQLVVRVATASRPQALLASTPWYNYWLDIGRAIATLESRAGGLDTGKVARALLRTFTASGTYTPTAELLNVLIILQGAGGGGGGATGLVGAQRNGGGGGGGGCIISLFTAADIGTSQVLTLGAAGAGVSAAAGTNGGNSTLGALCSAGGGTGGNFDNETTGFGTGGVGGTGTGNLLIAGQRGGDGFRASIITAIAGPGDGGGSFLSSGTRGTTNTATGNAGWVYGGGGAGGGLFNVAGSATGGAGAAGIMMALEFLSV